MLDKNGRRGFIANLKKVQSVKLSGKNAIVAQAYLKSFKKGKKWDRRIFSFKHTIKNFDSVPKK
jgi:hypothetical protein